MRNQLKSSKIAVWLLLASLTAMALLAASCDSKPAKVEPLLLSKDHSPIVVIAPDALITEEYAAKKLAQYLGGILQIEVAVVRSADAPNGNATPLYVGYHPKNAKFTGQKLDIEESLYAVDGNAVHIIGGVPRKKIQNTPNCLSITAGCFMPCMTFWRAWACAGIVPSHGASTCRSWTRLP